MLKGEKPGPPPRTGTLQPDVGSAFRKEGRLARRLRIAPDAVVLSRDVKEEVRHRPKGMAGSAAPLLHEWQRAVYRRNAPDGEPVRSAAAAPAARDSVLNRLHLELGAALGRAFLDGAAGEALPADVERAAALDVPLALEVAEELAGWCRHQGPPLPSMSHGRCGCWWRSARRGGWCRVVEHDRDI